MDSKIVRSQVKRQRPHATSFAAQRSVRRGVIRGTASVLEDYSLWERQSHTAGRDSTIRWQQVRGTLAAR
jgi:hypothetical protein